MSEDMAGSAAGTPRATTVTHPLLSERGFPEDGKTQQWAATFMACQWGLWGGRFMR